MINANVQDALAGGPRSRLRPDPRRASDRPGLSTALVAWSARCSNVFKGLIPSFSKLAQGNCSTPSRRSARAARCYGYKAPAAQGRQRQHRGRAARRAERRWRLLIRLYKEHRPGARSSSAAAIVKQLAGPARLQPLPDDDGDQHRRHRQRPARVAFFAKAAADRLEANGIAYTQHWGKVNALHQGPAEEGLWRQCRQMADGAQAGAPRRRRTAPSSTTPIWRNAAWRVELSWRAAIAAPMSKEATSRFVPRSRKVRILATLGPASDTPGDDPPPGRGRRRRLPHQHEPRHPCRPCEADRRDPRARGGARPADDDPRRPAGARSCASASSRATRPS